MSYGSDIEHHLTLIINPDLSANHKLGWFLPIKRLPVVFMFCPDPSAPSFMCSYSQDPFVVFVTHPRTNLCECNEPISLIGFDEREWLEPTAEGRQIHHLPEGL